jgi:cyclic pyranopterin phosphate synthase
LPEPEYDDSADSLFTIYPSQSTSASEKMSAEEIVRIAGVFVSQGVRKIRLTGGEPLIRKDARTIMEQLSNYDVELAITSNGMFIDKFIDTFIRIGLKSVNISLDSLNAQIFYNLTGRNEFETVFRNIELLIAAGFHVKVNMVVMNGYNDTEITDFIRWTTDTPVHIRFIEFMPFPGNQWRPEKLLTYKHILDSISTLFPDIQKLHDDKHDTAKKYRVNGHTGTFAVISTMSEPFCGGCNRLRLTADGKMRNCLFANTETDLLTPLRNGEDILPLITSNLSSKYAMLGGNVETEWEIHRTESHERTMMGIGG